jgi:multiple sugar transport system ATP-binding protein
MSIKPLLRHRLRGALPDRRDEAGDPLRRYAPGRGEGVRRAPRPANLFVAGFMAPKNHMPSILFRGCDDPTALVDVAGTAQDRVKLPACSACAFAFINLPRFLTTDPECIAKADKHYIGGRSLIDAEAGGDVADPTEAETEVMLRFGGREAAGRVVADLRSTPRLTAHFATDIRKACAFDPTTERLVA